jgi:hypothetical protein
MMADYVRYTSKNASRSNFSGLDDSVSRPGAVASEEDGVVTAGRKV